MLALLSTMALALAPMPTGADIQCVINGLSAEAAGTLSVELTEGSGGPSAAALEPLDQAVEGCRTRSKWSEAHAEKVGVLAVASIMGGTAEEQLQQAGISATAIDEWLEKEPEAVQIRLEPTKADLQRLVETLVAAGNPEERLAASGRAIGLYLGSLIIFQRVGRGLPIE